MAIPGGLWSSYGVTGPATASTYGIREDLGDNITIIDPDDYPTVAALEKTTTNGLYHEYLTDVLAATATSGALEGDTFTAATLNTRTRYGNVVQRFRKDFAVSLDQVELAKKGTVAGVRNEMDYQGVKAGKEILRNVDARIWSTGALCGSGFGATGTAALFQNLRGYAQSYITGGGAAEPAAGTIVGSTPTDWVTSATATPPLAIVAQVSGTFSTAALYALHQAMYVLGAKPDTLFCSPYTKMNISRKLLGDSGYSTTIGAAGLSLVRAEGYVQGGEYGPVIEYVKTDYGRLGIVMDRWIPRDTTFRSLTATATGSWGTRNSGAWALIEKAKVRLAYWRPLKAYPIAPQGDFMAAYMLAALTIEVLHPSCVGLAVNAID